MLIKLLTFLFAKVIGNLPEEQKREFWIRFNTLLMDIVKASAEGVTQGITK